MDLKSRKEGSRELTPRLAAIKQRVSSGFYDSVNVQTEVAQAMLEYWEERRALLDSIARP